MNTETRPDFRLQMINNAIEISYPILPADAEVTITLGGYTKEQLEAIAANHQLHVFTPEDMAPHYWIKLRNGNTSVILKTADYTAKTQWREV